MLHMPAVQACELQVLAGHLLHNGALFPGQAILNARVCAAHVHKQQHKPRGW